MWFSFRLYEIQQVHHTAFVSRLQMLELLAFVNKDEKLHRMLKNPLCCFKRVEDLYPGGIDNFSWAGWKLRLISIGMQLWWRRN